MEALNLGAEWRSVLGAWGAGLRSTMEYRASFAMQALFMLANNLAYLSFWAIFFARFDGMGGWSLREQALTYGCIATGFGLAAVLAGGTFDIAQRVASGNLDSWLLRPRVALLQAASSKMRMSGFGDIVTGPILLVACGGVTWRLLATFTFATLLIGVALASFWTLCGSAAFFAGRSDDAAMQGTNALITFAFYPERFFGGVTRVLLYSVIPSGIIGWLPASLLHGWTWKDAGALVAGTTAIALAAIVAWTAGLRRYESGSLTQIAQD